jgi:uncharacterized protein YecE (DUF72 family)
MTCGPIRIGCAGWTIPRQHASLFPSLGSHLERYAQCLTAVEINSSFYRPHRRATYNRWAALATTGFAFAVKAPKLITHELRLVGASGALETFLEEASGLGDKLGPLLFQLPPSLACDSQRARSFFRFLRTCFDGSVVCEPRHPDWFTKSADDLLSEFRISRAAVDPPVVNEACDPGGWNELLYFRLHGSPRVYYSEYRSDQLESYAKRLSRAGKDHPCWCIFDNTAAGAAVANALALGERIRLLCSPGLQGYQEPYTRR